MPSFCARLKLKLRAYCLLRRIPVLRAILSLNPIGRNWFENEDEPIAVLWNFSAWKRPFIVEYLPEYRVLAAKINTNWKYQKNQLDKFEKLTFITWGHSEPAHIREYAAARAIPIYRMEDGFIRSATLGCTHSLPLSLILDKKGLYFDATRPSELEDILNQHDFSADPALLTESARLIQTMRDLRISKYNTGIKTDVGALLGPKTRRRILVIGQLESDASLKYGLTKDWSNLALLQKAHRDHPEAEIIYRPHPDTLYLNKTDSMSGAERKPFYRVLSEPLILADLFAQVDEVYTMTSLSGCEALIHGLKVTVAGMPFYAGWGLTNDLQKLERRTRKLTLEELFCGAYLLYPRYLRDLQNPVSGCLLTMREIAISTGQELANHATQR